MLKISFNDTKPSKGVAVLCLSEGNRFSPFGQGVDMSVQGALGRGLQAASFQGKSGQTASFLATGSFERLVALGLGEARDRTHSPLAEAGGSLVAHLLGGPHTCVTVVADELPPEAVVSLAFGALLRGWRFDKYRTRLKDSQKIALREVSFSVSHPEEVARAFAPYQALAESVLWARSMIAEPANVIYPQTFVEQMESFRPLGLTVETLNRDQMKALGMGALLGVAQGSALEPLMGIVHWKGGAPGDAPVAFVGKGVTFDSGGLSLKPASAMEEMKGDMGGAAAVIAVMRTLAARGAKVNAVGVVALVENMPSGTAQRPGDIVTSMSGQTIEVLNTDAEGRLILADALHYTCQQFKPRYLVDLATLTGAMKVALGSVYGGLFSPHDGLAQQLEEAGRLSGERVWRLPLDEAYDREMNSLIADMKNISSPGCGAGSITAAQFLGRFVGDTPWAHLDIANVDMMAKDTPLSSQGPTGFGIRLLDQWVKSLEK